MKIKIQVPEKLGEALKKAIALGKRSADSAVEILCLFVMFCGLMTLSLKAPEMHNHWLRSKVGSKVYYIRYQANGGGGTGSAVKAPSGETYILTNDHVCGISKDGSVLVSDEEGNSLRRRIVAHDENSDLCLIEGVPGVEGLSVAKWSPARGETLNVIGHPHLLPLTLSKGELIGSADMTIPVGPISLINPETNEAVQIDPSQGGILPEQCMLNKHRQIDMEIPVFIFTIKVKMCAIHINGAYISKAEILPGNSGSPVVNFWGQVEGVAFASDETKWARIISLADVKAFLKNY